MATITSINDNTFVLTGDTYKYKQQLKAFNCKWQPDTKNWLCPAIHLPAIQKLVYRRKCSLCQQYGHDKRAHQKIKFKPYKKRRNLQQTNLKILKQMQNASQHPKWQRFTGSTKCFCDERFVCLHCKYSCCDNAYRLISSSTYSYKCHVCNQGKISIQDDKDASKKTNINNKK